MTVQDALRKIKVMLAVEEEVVAVTEDIKMADAELIDVKTKEEANKND